MSSKDVRVRFVRREQVDIEKLAQALLDLVRDLDPATRDRLLAEDNASGTATSGGERRRPRKGKAA